RSEENFNDGNQSRSNGFHSRNLGGNQKDNPISLEDYEPDENLVDFKSLLLYTGGDTDFLVEMINIFLEESPQNIRSLREFHEKQDWNSLGLLAHKCKSSYGAMGVKQIHALMKTIENACKNEKV